MRKKGGMELSINAIVILIIAMVVLGIGILFIRGLFAKSAEQLTTAISGQQIANPATADTPLVADREVLLSKSNPTKTVVLSVFNTGTSPAINVAVSMSNCVSGTSVIDNGKPSTPKTLDYYSFKTSPQDISANTYAGYQGIVVFSDKAKASTDNPISLESGDTIVCKLQASKESGGWGTGSADPSTTVTFTVTS